MFTQFNPGLPNSAPPDNQDMLAVLQSIRDNETALALMIEAGAQFEWEGEVATASFTATAAGTVLSVSTISAGQICPGMTVYVGGVAKAKVLSQTTGDTFGTGTYQLDGTVTYGSATAMTAASADSILVAAELRRRADSTVMLMIVMAYDVSENCTSEKYYYWASASPTWEYIGQRSFSYDGSGNYLNDPWS